jgi:hypothetical protein
MLDPSWRFSAFRERLAQLPPGWFERPALCNAAFRLCRCGPLEAFYAPLDWVNRGARLVLLGAAPGWHEMETAFRIVRAGLAAPDNDLAVLRRARLAARPPSTQRQRVLWLLRAAEAGMPALGGAPVTALFEQESALVHWTWVARFPVFVRGRNYSGRDPSILLSPLMRAFVTDALAGELAAIPEALVVPIGAPAADALWLLVQTGMLERDRLGPPLPDPTQWTGEQLRRWVSSPPGAARSGCSSQKNLLQGLTRPPRGSSEWT